MTDIKENVSQRVHDILHEAVKELVALGATEENASKFLLIAGANNLNKATILSSLRYFLHPKRQGLDKYPDAER